MMNRHIRSPEATLFEDPDNAKYVLKLVESISDQMWDSMRAVKRLTSPEEYKAFQRAICHVLSDADGQIVEPICRRHPSLDTRRKMQVGLPDCLGKSEP